MKAMFWFMIWGIRGVLQSIVWDSNPGSRKVKVANQFTQVRRPLCLDEFAPLKQNNDFHLVHVDSLLGGTDHASKSSKMKLFCSNYWSLERPILRTVPRWISCFRAAKNIRKLPYWHFNLYSAFQNLVLLIPLCFRQSIWRHYHSKFII